MAAVCRVFCEPAVNNVGQLKLEPAQLEEAGWIDTVNSMVLVPKKVTHAGGQALAQGDICEGCGRHRACHHKLSICAGTIQEHVVPARGNPTSQVSATTVVDAAHTTEKSKDDAREHASPRQTAPTKLDSNTISAKGSTPLSQKHMNCRLTIDTYLRDIEV